MIAKKLTEMKDELETDLRGRSIVFVGMMGSGKTAIGRLFAKKQKLPFFDADEEIENAAGMSVADYFSTYGEEKFREGEQKVISRLLDGEQCVLALGGGAFLSEVTRESISERALSLWLRADIDTLYSRVMRRPGKRPLLQTENPRATLAELLEKREPFYTLADITVETSISSKIATCDRVQEAVKTYLENDTR